MQRRLAIVCVVALLLTAAFSSASAQTDWDRFESGWVYITLAQQTSSGWVEFRDSYRILPDVEQHGVQIIYFEESAEYFLTAEDAFLLKEALAFLEETAEGEQRQMNGRQWQAFTFTNDNAVVLGQIELADDGNEPHRMLVPVDQMPELAKAIKDALEALN